MTHPDSASQAASVSNSLSEGLNQLGFFVCPAARTHATVAALNQAQSALQTVLVFSGVFSLRPAVERLVSQLRVVDRSHPLTPDQIDRVAAAALGFLADFGMPMASTGRCPLHGDACPTAP